VKGNTTLSAPTLDAALVKELAAALSPDRVRADSAERALPALFASRQAPPKYRRSCVSRLRTGERSSREVLVLVWPEVPFLSGARSWWRQRR
jgi:hypothetical protein